MATNDRYSVICVANMDKVAIANVFYVNVLDDSGTDDTPQSLATEFTSTWVDAMKANQSEQLEYECLLIRQVYPTSEPAIMFPLDGVGALTDNALPTNLTLCINTVSEDGTRPYRGRWFISGLLETQVDDGTFSGAVQALWSDFLAAIPTSFGESDELFQLHHYSAHLNSYTPITRGRLAAIPRKLRNRTPGLCSIS
jgi:hypothetical protein